MKTLYTRLIHTLPALLLAAMVWWTQGRRMTKAPRPHAPLKAV